jgi:hypothetical protein
MKTAIVSRAILLAVGILGYLVIGWGTTIQAQGLEAAISDQTTQPSLPVTVGGLVLGIALLLTAVSYQTVPVSSSVR